MTNDWHWSLALAALSVAALSLVYTRSRRRWRPVGTLSKVYMYPLKSGKYREVASAVCTSLGLVLPMSEGLLTLRDRVFVIYDENKMDLVTARKYPTLIFITTEPKKQKSVVFSHPDKPDIEVFVPSGKFNGTTIAMWRGEPTEIIDCGDEIASWVSRLALESDKGLRVGYWPEEETYRRDVLSKRPEERAVFKKFTNKFSGAYSDLASYLLLCQSSIDDLNSRLGEEVEKSESLDFRPNFLVEGTVPYEEDNWDRIKIGDVEFTNFRPCTRCIFTTISHKTGEKNRHEEPLKTLRKYRTMKMLGQGEIEGTIPVMGRLLGLEVPGTIREGDTVYVS